MPSRRCPIVLENVLIALTSALTNNRIAFTFQVKKPKGNITINVTFRTRFLNHAGI